MASTHPYGSLDRLLDEVREKLDSVSAKHAETVKKLDTTNPTFKPLVEYKNLKYPDWYSMYQAKEAFEFPTGKSSGWGYSTRARVYIDPAQVREQAQKFKDQLAELLESARATYNENQMVIAHNTHVVDRIRTFMRTCGIKDTYEKRDDKSRARVAKYYTTRAGYEDDIGRSAKLYDSAYSTLTQRVKSWIDQIDKYVDVLIREVQDRREAEDLKALNSKQEVFLATMRVKYNLTFDADRSDVWTAIEEAGNKTDIANYNSLWPEDEY